MNPAVIQTMRFVERAHLNVWTGPAPEVKYCKRQTMPPHNIAFHFTGAGMALKSEMMNKDASYFQGAPWPTLSEGMKCKHDCTTKPN